MHIFNKKFNAIRSAGRMTVRTGDLHLVEGVTGGGFMVVLASTALPEPTTEIVADLTQVEAPAAIEKDGWLQVDTSVLAEVAAEAVEVKAAPVVGRARALVIAACSQPEGATAAQLYAVTTWKKTSWNHQLNLAAKATGRKPVVRKVDGATRYFLEG